jgi:flagellar basal body-associated protein FliL
MKKIKASILLIAYVLTLGIMAFAGYYFYGDYEVNARKRFVEASGAKTEGDYIYIDLPRIALTLNSSVIDKPCNVRMDITLEVEKQYVAHVHDATPRITDRLINHVQRLDTEELRRPKVMAWLKPDLLREVNSVSSPSLVKDIIFRQFIIL